MQVSLEHQYYLCPVTFFLGKFFKICMAFVCFWDKLAVFCCCCCYYYYYYYYYYISH